MAKCRQERTFDGNEQEQLCAKVLEVQAVVGKDDLLKATRSKRTLLVTKGIATRSKDATSSSWPYY